MSLQEELIECEECKDKYDESDLNECDNCTDLFCDHCIEEHGHMSGGSDIGYEEDDGIY